MKLNSIHLFGILLLSLLLGSFLGRFIDIGDKYKEGNQNGSETTNQHTGGDIDMVPKPSLPQGSADPSLALSGNDNGESTSQQSDTTGKRIESFGSLDSLFDTILPSNNDKELESFEPYAPLREKLLNKSDLSKGITKDQIQPGQEHLYVLKSQVVPPSCPTNPGFSNHNQESGENNGDDDDADGEDSNLELEQDGSSGLSNGLGAAFRGMGGSNNKNKKCPPCPACARCPEPSFECKKVPNYSSTSNVLPIPVLTDFSQFGM